MHKRQNRFQPQLRVRTYHLSEAEPLTVKRISMHDIAHFWMPHHSTKKVARDSAYYIICNAAGEINFEEAAIFTATQLVGRNNVTQVFS